jgi:ribosomal protein S18 acetylase RimI-like enzyme
MAALSERRPDAIIALRNVRPEQLVLTLEDQIEEWRRDLNWDFKPSAELVRRFARMQALDGVALLVGARVAGYSYSVAEDGKGLIGDLYVAPRYRTVAREDALLRGVLAGLWAVPGMQRVEAQLMMLSSPLARAAPDSLWFRSFERYFLEAPLAGILRAPQLNPGGVAIVPWTERHLEGAARAIALSYTGHVDAEINDQYRSAHGARRFLSNIVQYPGCGIFFEPGSLVALDRSDQSICGLCLASLVSAEAGHITQVCVTPSRRGAGIGYELMRRSLIAMAAHGARAASLTATASNSSALRLYRQMGFATRRTFAAYVWDRG